MGEDLFDAVIFRNISRWSSDDIKHPQALRNLRKNGIRLFDKIRGINLNQPGDEFSLDVSVAAAKYQVRVQTLKSINGKIERLRQNRPVTKLLPDARTFDWKKGT